MNELIIYGILLVVWFALQLWILPRLGIPTCMSGACSIPVKKKVPVAVKNSVYKSKKELPETSTDNDK